VTLPESPDGSPQYYKFVVELPEIGGEVRIAGYSITARYRSPPAGGGAAAPVKILGFGAGPRAVGSVAINSMQGDPPEVARPREATGLRSSTRMSSRTAGIASPRTFGVTAPASRKLAAISPTRITPYRPSAPGPQRWVWQVDRHTDRGPYQLKVRAWHTCGALADPATYDQCGSALDWVVGSAGPFYVR
jgi:hypothetical protein